MVQRLRIRAAILPNSKFGRKPRASSPAQLLFKPVDNEHHEVSIFDFNHLAMMLTLAGDQAQDETRACLEANPKPYKNIFGNDLSIEYGYDEATMGYIDEITAYVEDRSRASEEQMEALKQKKIVLRLFMLLKELDDELMRDVLRVVHLTMEQTPEDIENVMDILNADFVSPAIKRASFSTAYTMVHKNGCRVPIWRQIRGDICYLQVETFDIGELFITATTTGYYLNGGLDENQRIKFKPKSETFRSLIDLLRRYSPEFSRRWDNQKVTIADRSTDNTRIYMHLEENKVKGEPSIESVNSKRGTASVKGARSVELMRSNAREASTVPTIMVPSSSPSSILKQHSLKQGSNLSGVSGNKSNLSLASHARPDASGAVSTTVKEPPKVTPPGYKKYYMGKLSIPKARRQGEAMRRWLEESSSEEDEGDERLLDKICEEEEDNSIHDRWYIQKLLKYMKDGNQTATMIALCSFKDINLQYEYNNETLREQGALEMFIGLLEVQEVAVKIGALKILMLVADNDITSTILCSLGIVQCLVQLLHNKNHEVKCCAAETLSHVVKSKESRKIVRKEGGIDKLVGFLDVPNGWPMFLKKNGIRLRAELESRAVENSSSATTDNMMKEIWAKEERQARCGAMALYACVLSKRNRMAARIAGIMPLLACQMLSKDVDLLIAVVGIVKEFARQNMYLCHIRTPQQLEDRESVPVSRKPDTSCILQQLVTALKSDNLNLRKNTSIALLRCAEDPESLDLVRKYDGLKPLIDFIQSYNGDKKKSSIDTLFAVTGAIWKLALSPLSVEQFQSLGAIPLLINFMRMGMPDDIIVHIVGALSEMLKVAENRQLFYDSGGVPEVLKLQLMTTNHQLVINVNNTIAQCALHTASMQMIDQKDGVRLLWSVLKLPHPGMQASACWAICPCVQNAKDSAELVRSLVGGIELLIGLLKSDNVQVLASSCAAIATIAKDQENLGVLTDHSVVLLLSKLICTNDYLLMKHLANAIAICCTYATNRDVFGANNVIVPLTRYLKCNKYEVKRATGIALYELSKNAENCIHMHKMNCINELTELAADKDPELQEACAGCIQNIRRMALANAQARIAAKNI